MLVLIYRYTFHISFFSVYPCTYKETSSYMLNKSVLKSVLEEYVWFVVELCILR